METIPTIEEIVSDLITLSITHDKAVALINQHIEAAKGTRRDELAGQLAAGMLANPANIGMSVADRSNHSYYQADDLIARGEQR